MHASAGETGSRSAVKISSSSKSGRVSSVLKAVTAVTSITLRLTVPYFLRWLPLGPRYLPRIYGNAAAYFATFALQAWLSDGQRVRSQRSFSCFWTLLFGWYDSHHMRTAMISFFINALLLLATWDFIWRGEILHSQESLSFSRVGFLDSSSAKLVVRSPDADVVRVEWKSVSASQWSSKELSGFTVEGDFAATVSIDSLKVDTEYEYRTNASHKGTFHTAKAHPKVFSMLTSSCIKPFFPYSPLDHPLRIVGLEHLSTCVRQRSIDFMLFLGDFIYIDLPHNFGWSAAHYRTAYRQVYASPSWSDELLSLPFIHMYDDHEIINDWSANETGLYQDAIQPFIHYHHKANPTPFRAGATHYTFSHGDISFFVMDNRRYRSGPEVTDETKRTMLGAQQLQDLQHWLLTEKKWKIVVSGVPFTRNWRDIPDEGDSWAGYLWERQRLLEIMWKTEGIVIISGDRHEHATTLFPSPEGKRNVIEFSTSPLSQFFQPFERSYKQVEDTDVEIYSHPFGVSKFGAFEFNTEDPKKLELQFELIVDGVKVWEYEWKLTR